MEIVKDNEKPAVVSPLDTFLGLHFKPAASMREANNFYTTEEIGEQLLAGGVAVALDELARVLLEKKYVSQRIGERICWLIV